MKISKLDTYNFLMLVPFYLFLMSMIYYVVVDYVYPPVTVHSVELLTQIVQQGSPLKIRYLVSHNQTCSAEISRVLHNDAQDTDIEIIEFTRNLYVDSKVTRTIEQTVPEYLPPGTYSYYTRAAYSCNLLQNLFGPLISESPRVAIEVTKKIN